MSEPRALLAGAHAEGLLPVRAVLKLSLLACLAVVAIAFAARRLSGALVEPLPLGTLVCLALVVAAIAAVVRSLPKDRHGELGSQRWLTVALTLLSFVVAAAVSLPGTSPLGLAALWSIVVAGEVWAWRATIVGHASGSERLTPISIYSPEVDETSEVAIDEAALEDEEASDEEEALLPPENVVQQLTRERLEDGGEQLTGSLRVSFAPRERTTVAHVAFCPPFAAVPTFTMEPWDGPSASVKVVQVLSHGARFEVKLERESALECSVLVAFEALVASHSGLRKTDRVSGVDFIRILFRS